MGLAGVTLWGLEYLMSNVTPRRYTSYNIRNNQGYIEKYGNYIEDNKAVFFENYIFDRISNMVFPFEIDIPEAGFNYHKSPIEIPFDIDVPVVGFNYRHLIKMAKERTGNKAEFKFANYLPPSATELYFNKKRPSLLIRLFDETTGYMVVYDAETSEEITFSKVDLSRADPICKTIASSYMGGCLTEFNIGVFFSPGSADLYYWTPAIKWIKENTPKESVLLTWWDYYTSLSVFAEREVVPASNDRAQIFDAARFLTYVESEEDTLEIARKYYADYVVLDWTMIGKSGSPHFIATSNVTAALDDPNGMGKYESYSQCAFSPKQSILKPQLRPNSEGGIDSVRSIVFACNIGGPLEEYIGSIIFEIKNDRVSDIKVTPIARRGERLTADKSVSWDTWKEDRGASILGVQSLRNILGNILNYEENPDKYINFPTFTTLVYVPGKFSQYMVTKLYLGDYMDEYRQVELVDSSVLKPEHFELVDEFLRGKSDKSYYGYVKVYKINYPEN